MLCMQEAWIYNTFRSNPETLRWWHPDSSGCGSKTKQKQTTNRTFLILVIPTQVSYMSSYFIKVPPVGSGPWLNTRVHACMCEVLGLKAGQEMGGEHYNIPYPIVCYSSATIYRKYFLKTLSPPIYKSNGNITHETMFQSS